MKKRIMILFLVLGMVLTALPVTGAKEVQAAGGAFIRVEFDLSSEGGVWKDGNVSARHKVGNYYYWAVLHEPEGRQNYNIIEYRAAKTEKGAGVKMFETAAGVNQNGYMYINGSYIITTSKDLENGGCVVYRSNLVGKKRIYVQKFGPGASSAEGKGYDASSEIDILTVYGGKIYASLSKSGMGIDVLSFAYTNRKAPVKVAENVQPNGTAKQGRTFLYADTYWNIYAYDCYKKAAENLGSGKTISYLGRIGSKDYYNYRGNGEVKVLAVGTTWGSGKAVLKDVTGVMTGEKIFGTNGNKVLLYDPATGKTATYKIGNEVLWYTYIFDDMIFGTSREEGKYEDHYFTYDIASKKTTAIDQKEYDALMDQYSEAYYAKKMETVIHN